jgi:hypothetical protein
MEMERSSNRRDDAEKRIGLTWCDDAEKRIGLTWCHDAQKGIV